MSLHDRVRLPEGVSDFLPCETARMRAVERCLLRRFSLCGYEEVRTPVLEYLSLYRGSAFRESAAIKTFDNAGRILALRPEFTTAIARLVSTRMRHSPKPLRFCYSGVAFENRSERVGLRRVEFTQAGVELMGLGGYCADAEVIALAASALEAVGLKNYLLDIGQVGFFKALMAQEGIVPALAEELRVAAEQRNVLGMEMALRSSGASEQAVAKIMALPSLYGGEEVIHKAMDIAHSDDCRQALEDLLAVYRRLESFGLADKIAVDLGMVHSVDYYTGVIFRGMSANLGAPLLSGGRYDALMDDFDAPAPATGFALGLERLVEALSRQGEAADCSGIDVVASAPGAKDIDAVEALRAKGHRVELYYGEDRQGLLALAQARGARALAFADGKAEEL